MSEVKVYEVTPSVFYPEQRAFPLDMPPGRYVSVEDCKRMVEEAYQEGYYDRRDSISMHADDDWKRSETRAALKRLGG
jgi:hypothetical protein